jgi:hypothetical protein
VFELFARRQQLIAIRMRPSVVLRIREFQVFGAERERHLDDLLDVRKVVAMQHAVQHHRKTVLLDRIRDALFQVECFRAAEEIV